jgi:hypothetical protein
MEEDERELEFFKKELEQARNLEFRKRGGKPNVSMKWIRELRSFLRKMRATN